MNSSENDAMKRDAPILWERAAQWATVWITTLTVLLVGITFGVRAFVPTVTRNSTVASWYVGLLPVILLAYLSISTVAARVHRSSRVANVVGAMCIPGVLLTIWVWYSQFDFWDGGP